MTKNNSVCDLPRFQGQPIETATCQGPICPIKPPPNKLELGNERALKGNLTSDCKCGCTLELCDGIFSLVVSSALCPNGYNTWAFTVNIRFLKKLLSVQVYVINYR